MNLTTDDVQRMKVVELRAELAARGLDNRGVKAVLTERLLAALAVGNGGTQAAAILKTSEQQLQNSYSENLLLGGDVDEADAFDTTASSTADAANLLTEEVKTLPSSPAATVAAAARNLTPPRSQQQPSSQQQQQQPVSPVKSPLSVPIPATVKSPLASPTKSVTQSPTVKPPTPTASPSPSKVSSTTVTPVELTQTAQVTSTSPSKVQQQQPSSKLESISSEPESSQNKDSSTTEADTVTTTTDSSETNKAEETEKPMEVDKDGESNKRKIDAVNGDAEGASDKPEQKKAKTESEPVVKIVPENEPDFDSDSILLDWYKSDLNLKISAENYLEAEPLFYEDFPFAYAGAKATYGFQSGKLYYEVKWVDSLEVKQEFSEGESKHVLRVGWSDLGTGLQLGQEKFSYGWDSTGKLFKDDEVEDFGETFGKDDVVGAIVNLEGTETSVELKFTKNGAIVGKTVEIPKADLEGKTLFPHVLSRNVKFEVNFGSKEVVFKELEEGYKLVNDVEPSESRVRGPTRADSKEDCEFLMIVGLAGCGKTKWAKDYAASNAEKHFNILGTSTIVERSIKTTANRKIDGFFQKAGKFVEKLIEIAPSRRRNYILDQSNVNASAQRRKSGGFIGFKRRCVVIVPSDEDYQKRIKAKEQEQGKSVPKSTLMDMKATFRLPDVGETFSEVTFPELDRKEAQELITKYNKEGVTAGYGHQKIPSRGGGINRFGRGRGRGGPPQRGFGFRGGPGSGGGNWRGPRGGGSGPPRGGGGFGGPRGGPRGGGMPLMRGPPRGGGPSRIPRMGGGGGRGGVGGNWSGGGGRGSSNGGSAIPTRASHQGNRNRGAMGGGGSRGSSWRGASGPSGGGGGRNYNQGGGGRYGQPQPFQQGGFQGGNWGQGGGQGNNWTQQQSRPSGSNNNSGFGGGFQSGYQDPWQQVPDQGFGQSWDSSGSGGRSGSGGTWQGYGGQTYGNYGNSGGRR